MKYLKIIVWTASVLSLLLFILAGWMDYEYQASLFAWNGLLDLSRSAPKWGILDFIPHDSWHIVQSVRNHAVIISAPLGGAAAQVLLLLSDWIDRQPDKLQLVYYILAGIAGALVLYGVGRALGFTLIYEILN